MKRRDFIRHTTHVLGASAFMSPMGMSSFAQLALKSKAKDKVLVLIYLQGGNDGLNTIVPIDKMSALTTVRPHVILPESKLLKLAGTNLALHPSLAGLKSLFQEQRLRIIQSVGYPNQNFSHFRSTDIWMSASGADELVNSGWTGRYLSQQHPDFPEGYPNNNYPHPLSIEIGYGSTMLFQGPSASMSMVLKNPTDFYELVNNTEGEVPNSYAGNKLRHLRLTAKQSQSYGEKVKSAAEKVTRQKEYPQTNLAEQLKIVARLIAGGLQTQLYLVRIKGFDTHANQVQSDDHTKGKHADLLKTLNDAIMAFVKDLEFLQVDDRVAGMTFSEFGRRIVSNASNGTDHGAAAPMFVFGNSVISGILGSSPEIPSAATYKDNLDWEFDFRQVYGSILEQWFQLSHSDQSDIMLDDFSTVPVINTDVVGVRQNGIGIHAKAYPNPFQDVVNISCSSLCKNIYVVDASGHVVDVVLSDNTLPMPQTLLWNAPNLPIGNYFVVFQGRGFKKTIKIVKK